MYTLYGSQGSGSASIEVALAYLREQRPAFLATLERIEQHPAVAPVFARHWPC